MDLYKPTTHITYIYPFVTTILDVLQASQVAVVVGRDASKRHIATSSNAGLVRNIRSVDPIIYDLDDL
jgi:hypothetical protein